MAASEARKRTGALVFGGTGTVGSEVVRGLHRAGVPTVFTYHTAEARAQALSVELGQRACALDLRDAAAIRHLLRELAQIGGGAAPDLFIHCAAVSRAVAIDQVTDEEWDAAHAINCRSAFVACQE